METTFDTLAYARKLEQAGFTREQAEVQAEAFGNFSSQQDEKSKRELATRGDLRETELRLQKEIEQVRGEIRNAELRLLKWQWGIAIALAVIMAKGFGWLGF